MSTGQVLDYLDTRAAIADALRQLARAVLPGDVLAIDLLTEAFVRDEGAGRLTPPHRCSACEDARSSLRRAPRWTRQAGGPFARASMA
jgi:hypothetical protein